MSLNFEIACYEIVGIEPKRYSNGAYMNVNIKTDEGEIASSIKQLSDKERKEIYDYLKEDFINLIDKDDLIYQIQEEDLLKYCREYKINNMFD